MTASPSSPLPFSVQPSFMAYFGRARTASLSTWLFQAGALIVIVASGVLGSATFWTAVVIALAISARRVILGVRRERVLFGGGEYRIRARNGGWYEFSAREVVRAAAIRSRGGRGGYSRIDLGREGGERLLRLAGGYWGPEDLGRLVADLRSHGVAVDSLSPADGIDGLARTHPWALAPWERHLRIIGIAGALALAGGLYLERFLS